MIDPYPSRDEERRMFEEMPDEGDDGSGIEHSIRLPAHSPQSRVWADYAGKQYFSVIGGGKS
jgi:hypothetical protein